MKAITLWQPYASLIAEGFKTIETRSHARFASLKGQRIAIHAGRRFDKEAAQVVIYYSPGAHYLCHEFKHENRPLGCIVCTAFVKDARWLSSEDAPAALCPTASRFGLVLAEIQEIEPIRVRGHQGIWNWRNHEA